MTTGFYARRRFTAPTGGVVKGTAYLIGALLVVARANADETDMFTGAVGGKWTLPKTTSQAWTEGQKLYWNDSTKKLTSTGASGMLVGVAAAVAGSSDTTGSVLLNGVAADTAEGPATVVAALTDSSGGATADGTIGAVTAPTAQTDSSGGVANATLAAQTLPTSPGAGADGTTPSGAQWAAAVAQLTVLKAVTASYAARQAENRAAIVALTDAVKELSTKQNELIATLKTAGIIASA